MSYIGNTVENQNYVPAIDYFNGDGSTVAFTLSRPVASVAAVQAVISNVPQNPGSAFTVSGSTITFTSAPPSGTSNIYVYYTSPNTQVVQPGQGTVGTVQIADASVTAAKLASGAAISNVGAGGVAQSNLAAGVAGNGPAFYAYISGSNQAVNINVFTKLQFQSELFDTNSCYDTSTYKFTPNVAGYYLINAAWFVNTVAGTGYSALIEIYKNGSSYSRLNQLFVNTYGSVMPSGSCLVYMNGTTDYLEVYAYQNMTNTQALAGSAYTYFSGALVRAA